MATQKSQKPGRPGMSMAPLLQPGGLAARGRSVADAVAADPNAAAAVSEWTKEPSERIAQTLANAQPAEGPQSDQTPEAVQTPAQAATEPAAALSAAQQADSDGVIPAPAAPPESQQQPAAATDEDDDPFTDAHIPAPRQKNLKPWTTKEKEVSDEVGKKGKGTNFRLRPDVYAKTWFLKEITPGMTWDKLADAALERYVNRKLKELGYEV